MEPHVANGRVRVYARVKPVTPEERAGQPLAVAPLEGSTISLQVTDAATSRPELADLQGREFAFDRVFPMEASQAEVFAASGAVALEDCLAGFNSTVLAYGQTSTGKTYSMLNHGADPDSAGILPRVLFELFLHIARDVNNVYKVEVSALQVYSEQIDDLLRPDHNAGAGANLAVVRGGIIPGLTWVHCHGPEEALDMFKKAHKNLYYAETKMNKQSSRSHAIFQVRLAKRLRATAPEVQATIFSSRRLTVTRARLSLVDLAGSERTKKTGVVGVQLREATQINRSLLALGNVMSALAKRSPHVPVRESKLTRVLESSTAGNCRISLLVCVSPQLRHIHETVGSLDFAHRAISIDVRASQNYDVVEADDAELRSDSQRAATSADMDALRLNPEAMEKSMLTDRHQPEAHHKLSRLELREEVAQEEISALRQAAEEAAQKAELWQDAAKGLELEVASTHGAEADVAARMELAEARSLRAHEEVATWRERALAAEGGEEAAWREAGCLEGRAAAAEARVAEVQECLDESRRLASERGLAAEQLATAGQEASVARELGAAARERSNLLEEQLSLYAERMQLKQGTLEEAESNVERLRAECARLEREGRLSRDAPCRVCESRGAAPEELAEALAAGETVLKTSIQVAARVRAAEMKHQHQLELLERGLLQELQQAALREREATGREARLREELTEARLAGGPRPAAAPDGQAAATDGDARAGAAQTSYATPSMSPEMADQYIGLLGVDPLREKVLFLALMQSLARELPEGWSLRADQKGRCYFWHHESEQSLWAHPDNDIYSSVVRIYRRALQQSDARRYLRSLLARVELTSPEHQTPRRWTGPYRTDGGTEYWHDRETGLSSWRDPRLEATRRRALRLGLLRGLLAGAGEAPRSPDSVQEPAQDGAGADWRTRSPSDVQSSSSVPVSWSLPPRGSAPTTPETAEILKSSLSLKSSQPSSGSQDAVSGRSRRSGDPRAAAGSSVDAVPGASMDAALGPWASRPRGPAVALRAAGAQLAQSQSQPTLRGAAASARVATKQVP